MGRLPKDTPFSTAWNPLVHRPGRRGVFSWNRDIPLTILWCGGVQTFTWCCVWSPSDPGVVEKITRWKDIILFSQDLPRTRIDSQGYLQVYLGRGHSLANRSGQQYVHRLVAMGKSRSVNPPPLSLPTRRDPTSVQLHPQRLPPLPD